MGVMACSRKNCESIMCDTYIPEIGYICNYCQKEFIKYVERIEPSDSKEKFSDHRIKNELEIFMETPRGEFDDENKLTVDEFFTKHTRQC